MKGKTALFYAAAAGMTETVKLLLDKGAGINTKDRKGPDCIDDKCESGGIDAEIRKMQTAVVRILLERGADVKLKDLAGQTALIHAFVLENYIIYPGVDQDIVKMQTEVLQMLMDKGAVVNVKDKKGKTALINLIISGENLKH